MTQDNSDTSQTDSPKKNKVRKIFYWGPYGENIGTVQGMLNGALAAREHGGHETAMLSCCGEWHEFARQLSDEGVLIYDLGLEKLWPRFLPKSGHWYRFFMFFVLLFSPVALARIMERERPDYIVTCLLAIPVLIARALSRHKPQVVAIIWGLPSFMMRRGDEKSSLLRRLESWLRLRLWRKLYGGIEYIAAVSDNTRERIIQTFGYSPQKVIRLSAPVATEQILQKAKVPCVHRWLNDKTLPVIIGLGRLSRQKGFDTLLKAFAAVQEQRPSRLLILGEGEGRESLQRQISELGLEERAELAGFYPNPFSFLRAADLFVLSSRWEDPCHAIIEAGYVGVPIVTTDCPSGPGEFIGYGKGGWLCAVDDVTEMVEAIIAALDYQGRDKTDYCLNKCDKLYTPRAHYQQFAAALDLK